MSCQLCAYVYSLPGGGLQRGCGCCCIMEGADMDSISGLGKKTGCVYDFVQLYGTSVAGTIQAIFSYVYRPYPDSDDHIAAAAGASGQYWE